ncbi:hypothetical protein [Nocardia sp. NPDC003963]
MPSSGRALTVSIVGGIDLWKRGGMLDIHPLFQLSHRADKCCHPAARDSIGASARSGVARASTTAGTTA